mmetsp:Transcript_5978/g.7758  ORF Transcript_5978/g.7758 Transcript_5978/m.7758 type:complete len:255 (-) Transcript_5978:13-777(-)
MIAKTYIFGYGSLICSKSRGVTCPELNDRTAIPVNVKGMERTWSKRARFGMTAMGIRFREEAQCAGVLVPISSEEELAMFDKREQGYKRHRIDPENVQRIPFLGNRTYAELFEMLEDEKETSSYSDDSTMSSSNNLDEGLDVWVYIPKQTKAPTKDHPIVQSYVDTILRGCMEMGGEAFAEEFLKTTAGWHPEEWNATHYDDDDQVSAVWVDDRSDPIYPRGDPDHFRKHGPAYDELMREHRPDFFPMRVQATV